MVRHCGIRIVGRYGARCRQNYFIPIPGSQPQPDDLPSGCLFAPRCPQAIPECTVVQPEMRELRKGQVRCIDAT